MARRPSIFLGAIIALAFLAASTARATPPVPTQLSFSSVQISSLTVDWQASTGPTIQFLVEVSSPFAVTPFSSTTVVLSSTFTALDPNTEYFAQVQAQDTSDSSSSTFTTDISTFTLANPPLSLNATVVSVNEVDLSWDENGNPSGTLYAIERSTDGILFGQIATQTGSTYADLTIQPGTSYAYRLRALNGDTVPIPTVYSNVSTVSIGGTLVVPKRPSGVWEERTASGGGNFQLTIHWHAVTERTDNSALSNLAGYQIYTAPSVLTPRAQWTLVTTVATESFQAAASASAVNYYSIRAVDTNGVPSDWSESLDDTVDLNHFFMAIDNITRLQLPQTSADILRFEHNSYGADLLIDLTEKSSDETGTVIRSIAISVANATSGSAVTSLVFNPAAARVVLGYSVQNGNVVAGAPEPRVTGYVSGTSPFLNSSFETHSSFLGLGVVSASNAGQDLSLFWFNGNEWVKTTGLVNTADNTVSYTGAHAGNFQIRAATHASGASLTRVYPRIITPNNDGWNDKAIFQFDNPQLTVISGKMYDITGALVASLDNGPNPDSTLSWDGKDSGGKVVPGGIYIYQIDVGGVNQSGTIVVAR